MNSTRLVTTIGAAILVPATLLIGSAGAAGPAGAVATTPAAAPAPAVSQDARAAILAKYGVYPLPVPVRAIQKFRLSKKQLKDIIAARKLANTAEGRKIRRLESGNNYHYADGTYFGAWNFDRGTWLSNGGGQFGRTANRAPVWAQDYIMFRTHKARGWSPWSTA